MCEHEDHTNEIKDYKKKNRKEGKTANGGETDDKQETAWE